MLTADEREWAEGIVWYYQHERRMEGPDPSKLSTIIWQLQHVRMEMLELFETLEFESRVAAKLADPAWFPKGYSFSRPFTVLEARLAIARFHVEAEMQKEFEEQQERVRKENEAEQERIRKHDALMRKENVRLAARAKQHADFQSKCVYLGE